MNDDKRQLPKEKNQIEKHRHLLQIPMPVWERMLNEGGLTWGKVTPFILEAITEKLDRMKPDSE